MEYLKNIARARHRAILRARLRVLGLVVTGALLGSAITCAIIWALTSL